MFSSSSSFRFRRNNNSKEIDTPDNTKGNNSNKNLPVVEKTAVKEEERRNKDSNDNFLSFSSSLSPLPPSVPESASKKWKKDYLDKDDRHTIVITPRRNPSSSTIRTTIHVIALVHGIMGTDQELDYVKNSLYRAIVSKDPDDNDNDNKNDDQAPVDETETKFVLHGVRSNNGNTLDGIAAGGTRIANEVNHLITTIIQKEKQSNDNSNNSNQQEQEEENQEQQQEKQKSIINVQLSFVSNSLGGLYSRYALSKIDWHRVENNADNIVQIIPALFVTTATPHLGIQNQTFLKLPRFAESISAAMMKRTGGDLFRTITSATAETAKKRKFGYNTSSTSSISTSLFSSLSLRSLLTSKRSANKAKTNAESEINNNNNNSLYMIDRLATESIFLDPLSKFRYRWAYANAYGTDFPVPTETAAFLVNDNENDIKNNKVDTDDDKNNNGGSSVHTVIRRAIIKRKSSENEKRRKSAAKHGGGDDDNGEAHNQDDDEKLDDEKNDKLNQYLVTMVWLETKKKKDGKEDGGEHKEDALLKKAASNNTSNTTNTFNEEKTETVTDSNEGGNEIAGPLPLSTLSRHLDELGWTKIFVDTRSQLPSIKRLVTTSSSRSLTSSSRSFTSSSRSLTTSSHSLIKIKSRGNINGGKENAKAKDQKRNNNNDDNNNDGDSKDEKGGGKSHENCDSISKEEHPSLLLLQQFAQDGERYTSSELYKIMLRRSAQKTKNNATNSNNYSETIADVVSSSSPYRNLQDCWPFGHSFLVASSKNLLFKWFYKNGQPLVDRMADDIIDAAIH